MKKEDYEITVKLNTLVKMYISILNEISKLNKEIYNAKLKFNEKMSELKDPLGDDYKNVKKMTDLYNKDLNELLNVKQLLERDIEKLRNEETEYLEKIKDNPNIDTILKKVYDDNDISAS